MDNEQYDHYFFRGFTRFVILDLQYCVEGNSSEVPLESYTESSVDESFTWKDIEWLKNTTSLKIVLKGILTGKPIIFACAYWKRV